MTDIEKQEIIALVKREVVPAIGCTEPMAVALCVAKASEILRVTPQKIDLFLSANVLKNALGVGIPGTGMIGLPIAVALGALIGKSEYGLEVLKDCCPEAVKRGSAYIDEKRINISLKENAPQKLYIEVVCYAGEETSTAIISKEHTNFVEIKKNDTFILKKDIIEENHAEEDELKLSLRKVFDFAMEAPLEDIRFILESAEMNNKAAELSFSGNYGHSLGTFFNSSDEHSIIGDGVFSKILAYSSGACDARMVGAMIPVMSNSGSGNQGISATLPVYIYAKEKNKSEEQLIRALMLSNLTVIYIKQSLGRLSALCGCVVAATGSCCAITWLMGGDYTQVQYAVKNMIANITGMICDGAKPSCALKVATGVSTAILSAMMARNNCSVTSMEGIIDDDVDKCIRNLSRIGSEGMNETDRLILEIMTTK